MIGCLQESMSVEDGLRSELETALLNADYEIIQVLLDFKADVSKVRLNRLVGRHASVPDEHRNDREQHRRTRRGAVAQHRIDKIEELEEQIGASARWPGSAGLQVEGQPPAAPLHPTCTPAWRADNLDEYERLSELFSTKTRPVKNWEDIDQHVREYCDPKSALGFAVIADHLAGLGGYVKQHLKARYVSSGSAPVKPHWQDLFLQSVRVQEWACHRGLSPKTRPSLPVQGGCPPV